MSEFLKPWRRKIGVVTLVMALLFVGCANITRFIKVGMQYYGQRQVYSYKIRAYGIECLLGEIPDDSNCSLEIYFKAKGWQPFFGPATGYKLEERFQYHDEPKWHWQLCGFHYGKGDIPLLPLKVKLSETVFVIPYWSIVIPLIMLSVWLLLSKPIPSTSKNGSDHVQDEGGT